MVRHLMRFPRTTQERRSNQEGWSRPRRRPHRLVHAWDETFRRPQRSWKKHRRHQWKPARHPEPTHPQGAAPGAD